MAKIAILGHGVVGSGVCEVVASNQESIVRRAGQPISIKRILDLRKFEDLPYADAFTTDFNDILNDDEISIVVEVMGGISPAYEYATAALKKGKSVVTSNKELVAEKGAILLRLAKENGVNFFFEASVGGGIPIIRPMHQCLAANEIDEISGILNGTTNFILTKMIKERMDFDTALKLAQDLGYAERNPSADVDGHDACRKICILASLAFGKQIHPENVHTEGIRAVTLEDVAYAADWGGVIKLIGRAKKHEPSHSSLQAGDSVECMVSPAFVSYESQLSHIDDVFNGVLVRGNATGDVVFYGKGAGKLPTASAVVADVIDIAKASVTSKSLSWEECDENLVVDFLGTRTAFYLRLCGGFASELKSAAEHIYKNVSFLSRANQPSDEIAIITPVLTEAEHVKNIAALKAREIAVLGEIRIVND